MLSMYCPKPRQRSHDLHPGENQIVCKLITDKRCGPVGSARHSSRLRCSGTNKGKMVQAAKDAKAHEKAEDPIFVLEHGIPIDSQHYLEHHLKLPLTRLFEPLMKNSNELLSGQTPPGSAHAGYLQPYTFANSKSGFVIDQSTGLHLMLQRPLPQHFSFACRPGQPTAPFHRHGAMWSIAVHLGCASCECMLQAADMCKPNQMNVQETTRGASAWARHPRQLAAS